MSPLLMDIKGSLLKIKEKAHDEERDTIQPGLNLFALFFRLGCNSIKDSSVLEDKNAIQTIGQLVADLQDWLLLFLVDYANKIDLGEYSSLEEWDFETRSGVQFLIDLFKDVDVIYSPSNYHIASNVEPGSHITLSNIFKDLEPKLEDLDSIMITSKKICCPGEISIPENVPRSHHWWWHLWENENL